MDAEQQKQADVLVLLVTALRELRYELETNRSRSHKKAIGIIDKALAEAKEKMQS